MTVDVEIDLNTIDFSDLEEKYRVEEPDLFAAVVIVDGIPVVDDAREAKLMTVLGKVLGKFGKIKQDGILMPMHDDAKTGKKMSKGFMFVEFENADIAAAAQKQIDGYRLDAKHTFTAIKFKDYEKYLAVTDEYVPPKEEEYKEKEQLNHWLMDQKARDQLAMLAGDEVTVSWNDKTEDSELVHQRENWTDSYIQWSPMGTYLTTVHRQGVALWGGHSWARLVRFAHQNVKYVEFSPKETYMVTLSPESPTDKENNARVWDVRSGKLLRQFAATEAEWPMFKWSTSDRYVARVGKDAIQIYELPAMTLVGGKPLKVENLAEVTWAPQNDWISFWTNEAPNAPARVTIMDVTTRSIVRTKNLFMVNSCKLYWQSDADYMCVRVERLTKTKKSTFTNLEMFCMRQKDIPIEVYEGLKERTVQSLHWEPSSDRFAVLSTEGVKTFLTMYKMDGSELKQTFDVECKSNQLFWSPRGRFFVLKNPQGELEFYDGDDCSKLAAGSHFHATDAEWDPSGRYFLTSVSYWRYPSDNGYVLWDLKGQQLQRKLVPRFKQMLWRPRPPTLLGKEQQKNIKKNLKDYAKEFEREDLKILNKAAYEQLEQRRKLRDEWVAWRQECQKRHAAERDERAKLRGTPENPIFSDNEEDDTSDEIEELVEEVVEETTEIVG